MTLAEIGKEYRASAALLQRRLQELRAAERAARDPADQWELHLRIAALEPMLTQCNDLACLCTHYYDRGYRPHEKYRV